MFHLIFLYINYFQSLKVRFKEVLSNLILNTTFQTFNVTANIHWYLIRSLLPIWKKVQFSIYSSFEEKYGHARNTNYTLRIGRHRDIQGSVVLYEYSFPWHFEVEIWCYPSHVSRCVAVARFPFFFHEIDFLFLHDSSSWMYCVKCEV